MTAAWPGQREWTAAEATAALPLVQRIAADLLDAYRRWREAVEAFELTTVGTPSESARSEAARRTADAQRIAVEVEAFRRELATLDVRVMRVEVALLGFRSRRDGEIAPLYWMPGGGPPGYDWPEAAGTKGTSTSWPSLAHDVAAKTSRA
jgi:hypothetical protein